MTNLPKFPDFRLFTISDTKWYQDYYFAQKLNPYADVHPENLYVWLNMHEDLAISKLNDAIILKYTNVLDNNIQNIIPLSSQLDDATITTIMSYLKDNNLPQRIAEIPSVICENLDPNKWIIENDRNAYEYILDTGQQSKLDGGDFSRLRRRINFFEREHLADTIDIKLYDKFSNEVREAFINHLANMPLNSSEEATQQNTAEPIAIKRNLQHAEEFGKKALIIKINDKIASLSMISYLDNHNAAINHLKVDYSIQYIFHYTIYTLAKVLKADGITGMNIEQDLGIDGLRTFKERLKPSHFLEKKIISPRAQ